MKNTNAKTVPWKNTRGESMIVAVILLLVFFTIGASILTAASSAVSTAAARVLDRQAYYYARSTLDAVDAAVQDGPLGDALKSDLLARFLSSGGGDYNLPQTTLNPEITLESDALEGLAIENAAIVYSGTAAALDQTEDGTVNQVFLSLQDVTVTFSAASGGKSYAIRVSYQYSGWATRATNGWVWDGKWTVLKLG